MVDIIVPAYNAHDTIKDCIKSISKQELKQIINIYIIDDGSELSYDYLLLEFNMLNINIIKLGSNFGPGIARNVGIEVSNGKYLFFLDSDDELISPTSIKNLIEKIKEKDVAIGVTCIQKKDGSIIYFKDDPFNIHGKMYSRKYIDKYKFRFPKTTRHEDRVFHQLILTSNAKIGYLDEQVYFYKYNEESLTNRDSMLVEAESLKDLFNGMDYFIDFVKLHNFNEELMTIHLLEALAYSYSLYNIYIDHKELSEKIMSWAKKSSNEYIKFRDKLDMNTRSGIYNFIVKPYDLKEKIDFSSFIERGKD